MLRSGARKLGTDAVSYPAGTFSILSVYLVGHGINNSKAFESLPSWVNVGRVTSSITVSTWAKPTHLHPAEAARQASGNGKWGRMLAAAVTLCVHSRGKGLSLNWE